MADRSQIRFVCTEQFKNAVGEYSSKNRVSISEVIRVAVAEYIDYDLSGDHTFVDKRKKYESVQARREATNERLKQKRNAERMLVELFEREQRLKDIATIEESLDKKKR